MTRDGPDSRERFRIEFSDDSHPPIEAEAGESLMQVVDRTEVPILFGCRGGVCGTCLVESVEPILPPPGPVEQETIQLVAPGRPRLRLACQLHVTGNWKLRYAGGF